MPKPFSFEMRGAKELEKALLEMRRATGRRVLRNALKKVGAPVVRDAKASVTVAEGNLRDSIKMKSTLKKTQRRRRTSSTKDVDVFLGAEWPKGAHAHLVEFGTVSMPARPFLRPAWDANRARMLPKIGDEIWKSIEREARRQAKKSKTK